MAFFLLKKAFLFVLERRSGMNLLQTLEKRIVVADGAMGTLLYAQGIKSCFEELNITQPEQVEKIHLAYLKAGAEVIQTNTYAANYIKLSRYGLEDKVKEINLKAVQLARKAAQNRAFVLGGVGGIWEYNKKSTTLAEIERSFIEQVYYLLHEGVDGLLLETYYDLEELSSVLKIARRATDLPIIAQLSLHEIGVVQGGYTLEEAFRHLEDLGADIVGLNCRLGPYHMIRSLEQVALPKHAFLSAYPNASLPEYSEGEFAYSPNAHYFGESAYALYQQGVRLIGGCCGTTPDHIAAIAKQVRGLAPITSKQVTKSTAEKMTRTTVTVTGGQAHTRHIHQKDVDEAPSIIVELDPPKHLQLDKYKQGAKALTEAGVDAITLADNSLASPRVCNMALAHLIQAKLKARTLVHLACRDRNLIGMQSHLLGLHVLGLNQLLAITGDPSKLGDFPGATSVYDLSSLELIQLIKQCNEGLSFSGKSLGVKTNFSVAAAFNPNVRYLEKAVERLEKKLDHGADYFISQPVFSVQKIEEVYQATKHLKVPIYIGIMPLTSSHNAEFLHHEVPGIKLSDEIRKRMAGTDTPEAAEREGLAIARELLDAALTYFKHIYIITPFLRYHMSLHLVHYIKQKKGAAVHGPKPV